MSGQVRAYDAVASVDGDARALRRIHSLALKAIRERIAIDEAIESRLAVVVLLTFSAQTADGADAPNEDAIAALCVDRIMARTASRELVAETL